jgi:hypothetical protein
MPMGESNNFVYDTSAETGRPLTTRQFYDGTQHPREFKRVWHLELSLDEPETTYVVPIHSDALHYPPEGKLRVYRSRSGGNDWEALTRGLPQENCYVNVLCDAMRVDELDPCGIYFGTTGGEPFMIVGAISGG